MLCRIALLAVVSFVLPAAPGFAQDSNPSAAKIIEMLTPHAHTRGILPLSPPAVGITVNFASGSAVLTPQAMRTLDALGEALSSESLANYRFRVEGHTDTVGTPQLNLILSERRAQAVATYIGTKFGVSASRMEPIGMGENQLLVPTAAQVPEERNRRVQVVNIGN